MKNFNYIFIFLFLVSLGFLFCETLKAEDLQWQTIPENEYIKVLETITSESKDNYDKLKTWRGTMDIAESLHFYNKEIIARFLGSDTNSVDVSHLLQKADLNVSFSLNIPDNNLFCYMEPNITFQSADKGIKISPDSNIAYSPIYSILTPHEFLQYLPNLNFACPQDIIVGDRIVGKMAFKDLPEKAYKNLNGDIRDPRLYFNYGGYKLWDAMNKQIDFCKREGVPQVNGQPRLEIMRSTQGDDKIYKIVSRFSPAPDSDVFAKFELIVKASNRFNISSIMQFTPKNTLSYSKNMEYDVIDGIIIPVQVQEKTSRANGDTERETIASIKTLSVNQPLAEDTFTYKNLGLTNGVGFVDMVSKIAYRFNDNELSPALDFENDLPANP